VRELAVEQQSGRRPPSLTSVSQRSRQTMSKKVPVTKLSTIFGDDALPAVGEGPSLVVSDGSVFATPEELKNMAKYITPEIRAKISAFGKRVTSLEAPTSTPSTLLLVPFKQPLVPKDAVETMSRQAIGLFDSGYTAGTREVEKLRSERDQAVQRANESAEALDMLQAQYDVLLKTMGEISMTGQLHAHGVAGGPRGPPPPRADASHGAAGAAGPPDDFAGF